MKDLDRKGGPFSDTLITYIIDTAEDQKRKVYFASTMFSSDTIDRYKEKGNNLGLVTLVTSSNRKYSSLVNDMFNKWILEFRTSGLNSWKLKHSNKSHAGKRIVMNYATSINRLMDEIKEFDTKQQLDLFNWYRVNLSSIIDQKYLEKVNQNWCESSDIKEITDWCKKGNYVK